MNTSGTVRKIISSPWFLAVIPAIVVLFFIPRLQSKYRIVAENHGTRYANTVFEDLDADNITEMVRSGKGVPYHHIIVHNNENYVYDQWNLQDETDPDFSSFFFGNYDNDRFKEIYMFTFKRDSLFLNVNELLESSGTKINRRFIIRIGFIDDRVTSTIYPAGFYDVNGDGLNELYFSITTGFGLEPRRVFYYDIASGNLVSGDFAGMTCQLAKLADADGDGRPEMFGTTTASGNYKTITPFSDQSSWLMVYDENLQFKFPPVEFPGFTNKLDVRPLKFNDFRGYLLLHYTASADSSVMRSSVMISSIDGKITRKKLNSELGLDYNQLWSFVPGEGRIFLGLNKLIEIDTGLNVVNILEPPFKSPFMCYAVNADLDGEEELILYSPDEEKMLIYDSKFEYLAETSMKGDPYKMTFSHMVKQDGSHRLLVSSADNSYFIYFERNRYFILGYATYLGVYFLFVLFIAGIRRITVMQMGQKQSLKQRLITLQLQGIKAQLDPHFTFNTLNSVASLIYLQDRQAAYDYMNKFTSLLRSMLNDAERIYRSLGEEIEFVTTYLELEKLRFGEKLEYSVSKGNGITGKEEVPKLVLHTFAENAVKHGLMPRPEGGILKITIEKENDYLRIEIEDNGIGRAASQGQTTSTGKGLRLTDEFYEILNKVNKRPIRHTIKDLYSETGDPAGTRVEVLVPLNVDEIKRKILFS